MSQGYLELAWQKVQQKHFPGTNLKDFAVLLIIILRLPAEMSFKTP